MPGVLDVNACCGVFALDGNCFFGQGYLCLELMDHLLDGILEEAHGLRVQVCEGLEEGVLGDLVETVLLEEMMEFQVAEVDADEVELG